MKSKLWQIYLGLIVSMMLWGFTFTWTTQLLAFGYGAITIITFRLLISSVCLLLFNLILRQLQPIERRDIWMIVLMSILQPFLYFIGENFGLVYVSPTVTSVIIATIPLLTPFAAFVFFRDRITVMNFIGLFVSFLGVMLVILKPDLSLQTHPVGLLYLTLAVVSAVLYSVIIYRFRNKYNPFTLLTWQNIIGTVLFIPMLLTLELGQTVTVGLKVEAIFPILALAVFGSTLAYIFYLIAIQRIDITKANAFTNTIPAFTAIFAYLVLGDTLMWFNMIGIAVVMGGLFLSQVRAKTLQKFLPKRPSMANK
ncbi:MAG TPA: DMT family transporter [Caldisericia bacterium]|nr:DMT family transporter [Caldisericia bacterium]HPF48127.1 DMT family transporter [Caldisericia bacterium]HPI83936.1 DMT family transporter [Caldisericia bacterium]HPQ92580.1 DMT family transporter [Caldisericia bacterium]HRV74322.1 DMT family transporter [Caldisericia bacterium]